MKEVNEFACARLYLLSLMHGCPFKMEAGFVMDVMNGHRCPAIEEWLADSASLEWHEFWPDHQGFKRFPNLEYKAAKVITNRAEWHRAKRESQMQAAERLREMGVPT